MGGRVTIVSSDKDLMQLVDDQVIELYDAMKSSASAPPVMEKFGVTPDKVVDVQALAGDSVDNVQSVPGIGVKTAAELDHRVRRSPKRCWRGPPRSSSPSGART
ncbi:MAG: 5'-3' exonuclease H3TH domain-containing protein [Alphaproteobacteria bacterium]